MKVTLRQLQVFEAVSTCGSIMKAAKSLGMSQGAASGSLKDLEIILQRPLFSHNQGRSVQITEEGKRLRRLVKSIINQVDELEGRNEDVVEGRLVVGATSMIAEVILPQLCVAFRRLNPKIEIEIRTLPSGMVAKTIERLELETALVEHVAGSPQVYATEWRTDELWLVSAPDHPLASRTALELSDLAGASWCMREYLASSSVRLRILLHETLGASLPVGIEATSNQAVRNLIIAGGGIGCLSRELVRDDVTDGRLVRLDVRDFKFTRALSLVRPKGVHRSRIAAAFDEFILSQRDG